MSPLALPTLATTSRRPAWRISVDGQDITTTLSDRLISLTLTDNRAFEADQLDLVLDDADGRLALPPRGALLRLAIGWENDLVDKGSYTVDEVEHAGAPDTLTIRARSADLRAGLTTQRERSWHATTLGELVQSVASSHGLEATIAARFAAETIDHLDQTNESDANLLTRLAGLFDAIATVKDERLLFLPMGGGVSASGKALPAVEIVRASGDQHRFSISDREAFTAVKATYNDIDLGVKGEVIWGKEEDAAEIGGRVAAPPAAPATPPPEAPAAGEYKTVRSTPYPTRDKAHRAAREAWLQIAEDKAQRARYVGAVASYKDSALKVEGEVRYGQADEDKHLLQAQHLAAKDAAVAAPAIDHSAENMKTLRHVYSSQANAKRAARTEWRRLQRGMASFGIALAEGRADLIPERPATVSGFKAEIDSTEWIIARVTHSLSGSGFTTGVELEIRATELPG